MDHFSVKSVLVLFYRINHCTVMIPVSIMITLLYAILKYKVKIQFI